MNDTRPGAVLALTTLPDEEAARRLARQLLESRLVACVNILPAGRSMYWWNGQVEEARECLLVLKTTAERWPELKLALPALHSYDVPELLAFDVADGLEPYLKWVVTEVQGVAQ
jgi:periplasmic divalent cation tolerance protein